MTQTDILQTDFKFPSTVYVVGSGMSATEGCLRIPPGAFVIACNRAIELPINASIWLAHDPAILQNDWFNERVADIIKSRRPIGLKAIQPGGPPVPLFERDHIAKCFPPIKMVFRSGGDLYKPLEKEDGMLSTRATVAGMALQLCYFGGVKHVVTCGVDMYGGYFNGEPHPQSGYDKPWPCLKEWEWLVGWLVTQGMEITRIEDMPELVPAADPTIERDDPAMLSLSVPLPTDPDIEFTYDLRITKRKGNQPVVSLIPPANMPIAAPPANPELDATGLPTIGYLCMTVDPVDKMNAVHDFMCQDWPANKKILYLLKQRDGAGLFPPPLWNNLGLNIIEVDVDFLPWPELWLGKLEAYLRASETAYTLWFDEDDRYPSDYTRRAMQPILDGQGPLAWSWDCIIAEYNLSTERLEYRVDWYNSPIGQLAIETNLLRKYTDRLWAICYDGDFHSPKRKQRGMPYGGAQDDRLRQLLQADLEPIPQHDAMRVYFIHSKANSNTLRPAGNSIDTAGAK